MGLVFDLGLLLALTFVLYVRVLRHVLFWFFAALVGILAGAVLNIMITPAQFAVTAAALLVVGFVWMRRQNEMGVVAWVYAAFFGTNARYLGWLLAGSVIAGYAAMHIFVMVMNAHRAFA